MRNIQIPSYQSGLPTDSELENFESDCLLAQLKFSNSSGLDMMNQAIGTTEERRQAMIDRCVKITDDEISERIAAYNRKMNPALVIEACAACGIQVLGETLEKVPLNECELFKLSSHEMANYLNLPYRRAYSRTEIQNESGEIQAVYYLHSQHLHQDENEFYFASLCAKCLHQIKLHKIPEFSIASGMDFGNPLRLGLPSLSAEEKKLISLNTRYSHIFKLVLGQMAMTGHMIAFEHEGMEIVNLLNLSTFVRNFES